MDLLGTLPNEDKIDLISRLVNFFFNFERSVNFFAASTEEVRNEFLEAAAPGEELVAGAFGD